MKNIEIKTQADFDALPRKFDEYTEVRVDAKISTIYSTPENSYVKVNGGTISSVCGGTISSVCGGTISEVWGGTISEVWGGVITCHIDFTFPLAFMFAIIISINCKVKFKKRNKTVSFTEIKTKRTVFSNSMFCDTLEKVKEGYVLYKSVNPKNGCDYQTGKIKYEGTVTCPDWDPNVSRECGGGLHLSPTKAMALSYHNGKVLRCAVKPQDFIIYQAGNFTKVRCKKVTVIGEAE
jgi:hypothetical protein